MSANECTDHSVFFSNFISSVVVISARAREKKMWQEPERRPPPAPVRPVILATRVSERTLPPRLRLPDPYIPRTPQLLPIDQRTAIALTPDKCPLLLPHSMALGRKKRLHDDVYGRKRLIIASAFDDLNTLSFDDAGEDAPRDDEAQHEAQLASSIAATRTP